MRAIAIDVAVGQIRAALVSQGSDTVEYEHIDRPAQADALTLPETCGRIGVIGEAVLQEAQLEWSQIAGIGIALPGPINRNGVMGPSGIIPTWQGQSVIQHVRMKFPALGASRIALVNDANASALGESLFGAGMNARHVDLVYFVVRAGIGAGIIVDGTLHLGANGNAGEWGHVVVDPDGPHCEGCGRQRGCLETLASGNAMAAFAVERFRKGKLLALLDAALARGPAGDVNQADGGGYAVFSLPEVAGGIPHAVWASDALEADRLGDPEARQIVHDAGTALGKAVVQAIQILNPHMIVIGGVAHGNTTYLNAAMSWAAAHCDPGNFGSVTIQYAIQPQENTLLGLAEAVFSLPVNRTVSGS